VITRRDWRRLVGLSNRMCSQVEVAAEHVPHRVDIENLTFDNATAIAAQVVVPSGREPPDNRASSAPAVKWWRVRSIMKARAQHRAAREQAQDRRGLQVGNCRGSHAAEFLSYHASVACLCVLLVTQKTATTGVHELACVT